MKSLLAIVESVGWAAPLLYTVLFLAASFLMIWRLESMSEDGMEGTVLGTLIMPYCSGLGNLIFAILLAAGQGSGAEVMTNCLVNNVTNLTLLIGLPAILWGVTIIPGNERKKKNKKKDYTPQLNRLSLMLTLFAVLFFTGATWVLARDGKITSSDGMILVGLFLFWQCFHVFEVMKTNVRENRKLGIKFVLELLLLAVGAVGIYASIDWLLKWANGLKLDADQVGWLSGLLMVVPNGLLALYYGWKKKSDVVYSSQVGDGHICIPFCIGLFALFRPITVPGSFQTGVLMLGGALIVHFVFVALFGRLPRIMGGVLIMTYGVFFYKGLLR